MYNSETSQLQEIDKVFYYNVYSLECKLELNNNILKGGMAWLPLLCLKGGLHGSVVDPYTTVIL